MNLRRDVPFGDGADITITRVIRAQANFAEYVPLTLLLMGFLEVTRYSIYLLHALGVILVVARLLYGLALSFGWQPRFGRVCRSRAYGSRAADRSGALHLPRISWCMDLDAVSGFP